MRVSVEIRDELIILIDKLKLENEVSTRSRTIEILLEDLLLGDEQIPLVNKALQRAKPI